MAAASLAQVHWAVLKKKTAEDSEYEVAVKV